MRPNLEPPEVSGSQIEGFGIAVRRNWVLWFFSSVSTPMGGVQPPPCSNPTNATIRTYDHCTSFAIPADKFLVINEGYYLPWSWLVMTNEPSWMEVMITSMMENQNHWITWICLFMMDHQWLVNRKVLTRFASHRGAMWNSWFLMFLSVHACISAILFPPRIRYILKCVPFRVFWFSWCFVIQISRVLQGFVRVTTSPNDKYRKRPSSSWCFCNSALPYDVSHMRVMCLHVRANRRAYNHVHLCKQGMSCHLYMYSFMDKYLRWSICNYKNTYSLYVHLPRCMHVCSIVSMLGIPQTRSFHVSLLSQELHEHTPTLAFVSTK